MKLTAIFFAMLAGACSGATSGQEACAAAGGQCRIGAPVCPNIGPQDCRTNTSVEDPGGHYCCLPCPSGTKPNDAGTSCTDAR
jgi:hypothetical protein